MARAIMRGGLALAALLLIVLLAALGYRAWRQHLVAQSLAIATPRGIDEARFVRIGGIDQFVQIRGEDRGNPVLLILQGGPGISMVGLTPIFRPWEKYFTVVQWDQRGTGKTYGRNGGAAEAPQMTIARMTQDGLEVAAFLRRYLHKDKIVVLGHSWGTVLGLRMVRQQPAMFSAYVGTGQLVDKELNEERSYAQLLTKVRAAHDTAAIADLVRLGPPPYKTLDALYAQRKWLSAYDTAPERDLTANLTPMILFAPNYALMDIYDFQAATPFAQAATYAEINAYDARKLGLAFDIPFFVIEGSEDNQTPTALARDYVGSVRAPVKRFVVLPGGGHSAMLTMPDAFLKALLTYVRPVLPDGR
jgi:pimeloyl-ACP methyl ester carboxylesterase